MYKRQSQYFFKIGNYIAIIIIPIGVTLALFYATTIVFDSFAQEHHRKKIKSQYKKNILQNKKFQNFLKFPIVKPLLIVFAIFSVVFFPVYFISQIWFNNIISFVIAENIGTIFCIFSVNLIEKRYGKVRRF